MNTWAPAEILADDGTGESGDALIGERVVGQVDGGFFDSLYSQKPK